MKTAVVILNYNGAEHLRRFLPSVVDNTAEADIIVADNGSQDDSADVLHSEFPSVRAIRLDKNYGFAEGYNRALKQLPEYDLYVLLNSDVEVPQGWLRPLVRLMQERNDVAAVAPKIRSLAEPTHFEYAGACGGFIDYLGYPFCRGRILQTVEQDYGQYDTPREVFWASGAAFCCRAEVFNSLGGFCSEFFAHMEEIDLCWRMQLAGWKVMVEPSSYVLHLGGGTLGNESPTKLLLNHRNNLAMLFRCASPLQRAIVAVVRPATDLAAAISYLLKGNREGAKAVWRAWREFLRSHALLSEQRMAIRANIKCESKNIYKGVIVLRYALGRHTFNKLM